MPKKDSDLSLLQSYHPISLINVAYKIFETVSVAQMSSVISNCIHVDQSGVVHNRFLKDNLRTLFNIIDFLGNTCFSFILFC